MDRELLEIVYDLHADGGQAHRFTVRLDSNTLEQVGSTATSPPDWTNLEVEQCVGCPLRAQDSPQCPAALSLAAVISDCEALMSYAEVDAEVYVANRVISARVSMQNILSSLAGLLMATSGCPNVAFLKPMARFHMPFATMEETVFRATSSYLLGQYFRRVNTGEEDFTLDGLERAYDRLHEVNVFMARRLRHISSGDANLNAIVRLDMFTHELPYAIGRELDHLAPYFNAYWQGAGERSGE